MAPPRLQVLAAALALALALAAGGAGAFEFQEATVDAIQLGFRNGSITSAALVRFYLDRIARLNPLLRAVIEVNPDAPASAAPAPSSSARPTPPSGPTSDRSIPAGAPAAARPRIRTSCR